MNAPAELRSPILLISFEGWNDAAESATDALDHLLMMWDAFAIGEIDSEEFFNFQDVRPHFITTTPGQRELLWPHTSIYGVRMPRMERDIVIIRGVEPHLKWRTFSEAIVSIAQELKVSQAVGLGALLSDNAHTRPFPVIAASNSANFESDGLEFTLSDYEGPTGILGVVLDSLHNNNIPSASLWVHIPHYAAGAPNPKATLALLSRVEMFLDTPVDLADLTEEAAAWETDMDSMAADDEELTTYVRSLEEEHGENNEGTAESIADEFEQYLRRRNAE